MAYVATGAVRLSTRKPTVRGRLPSSAPAIRALPLPTAPSVPPATPTGGPRVTFAPSTEKAVPAAGPQIVVLTPVEEPAGGGSSTWGSSVTKAPASEPLAPLPDFDLPDFPVEEPTSTFPTKWVVIGAGALVLLYVLFRRK